MTCLERLYKTEIPELADEMGAKYYGILDKLYQYVRIMIWIKLMNWQKNWKWILGGYLSETNSIGYR